MIWIQMQRFSAPAYLRTNIEKHETNKTLTFLDCFDLDVSLFYAASLTNVLWKTNWKPQLVV